MAWRGHDASLREVVSRLMVAAALDEIPVEQLPSDITEIPPALLEQIVAAAGAQPLEAAPAIAEAARRDSAMGQQPQQWSRYEHPVASTVLMGIAGRIEAAIAAFAAPPARQSLPVRLLADGFAWTLSDRHRPAIGTLGTGQLMASAQVTADDSIVVLVENGLFPIAGALAQVGVLGYQEVVEDGVLSEATVQAVSDVVASVVVLGHPLGVPVRPTPPALRPHVGAVEDAILVFVLAHEYAHVLNGDLTAHPLAAAGWDRQPDLHERELLADSVGLRLTMAATAANPQLAGAALWGPLLFLAGLEVLRRADATMRGAVSPLVDDPAGPTPAERVDHLVAAVTGSELVEVYAAAVRAGLGAHDAVGRARDLVLPALEEVRDEFSDLGAAAPAGYPPELVQQAVLRRLWQAVLPRVAAQGG